MRALKWLNENFEEFVLVSLLVAMTLIMGVQICARYIFNNSLTWTEELTRFLFIWSGFLSVSYCTKKCISIKVEQLLEMITPRQCAGVKVFTHTIELIFFIYLIPFAWSYLMSAVQSGQTSPACNIPMYYVQVAPLFSFLLVIFRIAQRWVAEFKTVMRKGDAVK